MNNTEERFRAYLNEMNYYRRANILFSWDMYTATPRKGYQGMADALTFFSTKYFELSTSDELLGLLQEMKKPENYDGLDAGWRYTVDHMLEDMEKDRRIPKDFYEEFVATSSKSMQAWEDAKNASDFSIFAPYLAKLIKMTKEKCAFTDPGKEVYEVLLDQYEKGMDSAAIDRAFDELKKGLLPLLDRILAVPQPVSRIYEGTYDVDSQKKVQDLLLDYIGFRSDSGATAESMHPFTTGFSRWDVRVTNHYHEHDPISAMFSAIHEGGHAIFMQNVDPALEGTAADDCCYMGIHESQSRFFENILGRRKSFWLPIYDKVQELLPDLRDISIDEFVREINHVQNSFIRTEADEVTYGLHVILRYEMEKAIFRDNVPVDQLPALWNQKMQEYLHLTPANDAEGILQDMHWSDASFGYFPSYLLGSLYDGMFLDAMVADLGDIDAILARGEIAKIREWLNTKIHQYGSLRLPKDVLANVCGKELTAEPLLRYFNSKY